MKKFAGLGLPFILTHFICCGVLLYWLIGSGLLLTISNEGTNKFFLLPILLILGILVFLYRRHENCCKAKTNKELKDYGIQFGLYSLFIIIFSLAFLIYIFIPWWIPGYDGGPLLP